MRTERAVEMGRENARNTGTAYHGNPGRATASGARHCKEEEVKDLQIAFETQPRRIKRLKKVCS
jgi:hypothetical protein